ncbi:MAG: hypothetical protein QM708_00550 [Propioniciclava sp.]|uniref:hypothetical protein n=1 Tax=Propioniciclava sp. TaxID=2038686 RepID=UPI0039E23691
MERQYRWQVQPRFFVILSILVGLIFGVWGVVRLIAHVTAPRPPELPRGGRTVFPEYRLFGYSGYPDAASLGRLGTGDIDERMAEIEKSGQDFLRGRKLMPVMELIAVTVHPTPGSDGMYRTRVKDEIIESWLATARKHQAMLLLNIQPGRAKFLDEVKHFERWLREPEVGLALDPEWAVGPDQVPGKVFGRTSGPELDEVARYVAGLVAEHDLPEKVLLYHQLHVDIVAEEDKLATHPGVVLVKSIDGIGTPKAKTSTWQRIVDRTPEHVHVGFKLFFEEDARHGPLMTPDEVMALRPEPEYILYE